MNFSENRLSNPSEGAAIKVGYRLGNSLSSSVLPLPCVVDCIASNRPTFSCFTLAKFFQNKVLTGDSVSCFLHPDYAINFGQRKLFFIAQQDFGRGVIQAVAG